MWNWRPPPVYLVCSGLTTYGRSVSTTEQSSSFCLFRHASIRGMDLRMAFLMTNYVAYKRCKMLRNASCLENIYHIVCVCVCVCVCLQRILWSEHGVSVSKVAVYRAVVLSSLLYGCESWTLYRRSIRKLDQFHLRCLRRIAGIKWQDRVPNTDVLRTCQMSGIEAPLLRAQFRWAGHVVYACRTTASRSRYSSVNLRLQGGPVRRYKDTLKLNLKQCGINVDSLCSAALNRTAWRSHCREAIDDFEEARVAALEHKRAVRKGSVSSSNTGAWPCDRCKKICQSRIGLYAHQRTHRWHDLSIDSVVRVCL